MKRLCATLTMVGLAAAWAFGAGAPAGQAGRKHGGAKPAGQKAPAAAHKAPAAAPKSAPAELKIVTLTGTLQREEVDLDGVKRVHYALLTSAGETLPLPTPKPDNPAGAALEKYVGQVVTVSGKGEERVGQDGKTVVAIYKVEDVKGPAPVVAPAPTNQAAVAAPPAPSAPMPAAR